MVMSARVRIINTGNNTTLKVETNEFAPGTRPHLRVQGANEQEALRNILASNPPYHFSFQPSKTTQGSWSVIYRLGKGIYREGIGETIEAEDPIQAAVRGVKEELGSLIPQAKFVPDPADRLSFTLYLDEKAATRLTDNIQGLGLATEVISFRWEPTRVRKPEREPLVKGADINESDYVGIVRSVGPLAATLTPTPPPARGLNPAAAEWTPRPVAQSATPDKYVPPHKRGGKTKKRTLKKKKTRRLQRKRL